MRSETYYTTGDRDTVLDITRDCERFVADETSGLLHVFVPHATAGIAILETGAGSDDDLLSVLEDLLPASDRWRHRHGSPGHVAPTRWPFGPALRDRARPRRTPPARHLESVCLVDLNIDNHEREVRLPFLAA